MGWGKGNELFAFDFLLVLGVERMEHVFHPLSNINCYFTDWVYLGSRTPLIEIRIMKLCDTRQFLGGSHYHLLQKHPFFSNCKCVPLFRACGKGEAQVLEIPSVFFLFSPSHLISWWLLEVFSYANLATVSTHDCSRTIHSPVAILQGIYISCFLSTHA